jgi:hypothetical protein
MERPYVTGGGDFENTTGIEGLTRLDVEGVSDDFWSWDYRKPPKSKPAPPSAQ